MELLVTLLLAHLLADFPLQTDAIAASKTKSMQSLLSHILIHMGTLWALLSFSFQMLPIVFALGVVHFAVDWLKPRVLFITPSRAFIVDQIAHFVTIAAISYLATFWYKVSLTSVLPEEIVYLSLLLGTAFAMMVFVWIWTNSLSNEKLAQSPHLRWSRMRLLQIEQRAGYGLICFISITKIFM